MTEATTKDCPFCGEIIKEIAKKCKHCGEFMEKAKKPTPVPKDVTCQICGETTKVDSGSCEHCNEPLTSAISTHLDTIKTAFLRNRYLWGMVLWTVLMCFIDAFIGPYVNGGQLFLFQIAGFYVLEALDNKDLKKRNLESPSGWTLVIIPVYLWKRLSLTNEKKTIFWSWIASLVIATTIATSTVNIMEIAEEAKRVINTKILTTYQKNNGMECMDVIELDEYADNCYRANAVLSNGDERDISIRIKGDRIYVQFR